MMDHILIATDGSDQAGTAEEYAIELAEMSGADLDAIYVIETRAKYVLTVDLAGEEMKEYEAYGEETVKNVIAQAADRGIDGKGVVKKGKIAPEIVEYAHKNDIDHIVVGRKGHGSVGKYLGSTAEKVARMSNVPVTIVELPSRHD